MGSKYCPGFLQETDSYIQSCLCLSSYLLSFINPSLRNKTRLSLCRVFGHLTGVSKSLLCRNVLGLHVGGAPAGNLEKGFCPSVCKWTYQQSVLSKSIVSQLLPQVPLRCQDFYSHDSYKRMNSLLFFLSLFFSLQAYGLPRPSRVSQYKRTEPPMRWGTKITDLWLPKGKGGRDTLGSWDSLIHTTICKTDNQRGLQYSTGNYTQYFVITYKRKEYMYICMYILGLPKSSFRYIYISESLCCTPEMNTTL